MTDPDPPREDGVEFIQEDDGRITARDVESGVASYGETKAEALAMLAEALELHSGEEEGGDLNLPTFSGDETDVSRNIDEYLAEAIANDRDDGAEPSTDE